MTSDVELPSGWVHLAAVKGADRLRLYVNGKQVAESSKFDASRFNLANKVPLSVGRGQHDHFNGGMSDVRFYRHALSDSEVKQISK